MSRKKYVAAMMVLCCSVAACGVESSLDTSDSHESLGGEDEGNASIEQDLADEDAISGALADDCGGNLIFRKTANAGGAVVGELVVYYNSNNGNNCARFNHLGPAYGVSRYTEVRLVKCSTINPGNGCGTALAIDTDPGQYAYYAGPVRVYAPQNCVTAEGRINWNGIQYVVSTNGVIGC